MRSALLLLYSLLVRSDYSCLQPLNDECPPQGRAAVLGDAYPQCDPYAPPVPPGADLLALRTRLINTLFGVADGVLPSAPPDAVTPAPLATNTSRGCWCSTLGNCPASSCQWHNNLTSLVFTTTARFPNGSALSLNSTAFWTLNTSGVAPSNYIGEFGPPAFPSPPLPPQRLSGTLVLWHNGHNTPCVIPGGDPDYDGTVDWLNQLGYDVLSLHMPTYQVNAAAPPFACNHGAFADLEAQGLPVFRYFLEPIARAVAFALARGYSRVVMGGLSGGGWSTTLAAAIDPRIGLSMPVAGSMPCDFAHVSWDFEQQCNSSWAMVANYSTLYALAALEPARASVQIIHEQDPCCFHGCHRHGRIRQYNEWVAGVGAGLFQTCVTAGNVHEVNPRDKAVFASLLDKYRIAGALTRADLDALPFNLLREY